MSPQIPNTLQQLFTVHSNIIREVFQVFNWQMMKLADQNRARVCQNCVQSYLVLTEESAF